VGSTARLKPGQPHHRPYSPTPLRESAQPLSTISQTVSPVPAASNVDGARLPSSPARGLLEPQHIDHITFCDSYIAKYVADAGLLSSSHFSSFRDLTGLFAKKFEHTDRGGSFADVYEGIWVNIPDGLESPGPVAIKIMRHMNFIDESKRVKAVKVISSKQCSFRLTLKYNIQRLRREATVWQLVKHENVLPLLGIANNFGLFPALISPWMEKGTRLSSLPKIVVSDSFSKEI
jgi:hypothetical protein